MKYTLCLFAFGLLLSPSMAAEPVVIHQPITSAHHSTSPVCNTCETSCDSCSSCKSSRGWRLGRFWSWLTYRPLSRGSGRCCTSAPCCNPPLYTFFLHRCAHHDCGCEAGHCHQAVTAPCHSCK